VTFFTLGFRLFFILLQINLTRILHVGSIPVAFFSGAKKAHDWMVDQVADLFHTTHKVKTHQVVKCRGQYCGDVDLTEYLANATDPVSLVLDLLVVHDRVGSSTDPTLNGQVRYPNNLDQSTNDTAADKVRKYRADYNMNPPNTVSIMTTITSTSGSFSVQVKSKVGLTLAKEAVLRITLNLDGAPIISKSHTHPSHSQTSRLLTSSLSLGIPVPRVTQCM
jgi:hypothetical protein